MVGDALNHAYFDGTTDRATLHIPPDPHGAVGPNHMVTVVNCSLQVFNIENGDLVSNFRLGKLPGPAAAGNSAGEFFAPLSPVNNLFDPRVIFDQQSGRFVVVALERRRTSQGDSVDTSRILIAVSATNDATGAWYYHAINSSMPINGNQTWADFPNIAVDGQALYITMNMFRFAAPGNFEGARVWILDKAGLYASQASATAVTDNVYDPTAGSGLAFTDLSGYAPAQVYGASGVNANGQGTFLVGRVPSISGSANERLSVIRVDSPLSSPTFTNQFVETGDIHNNAVLNTQYPDAPQSGVAHLVNTGDGRVQSAVWRGGNLYACNTIVPPSGPDAGQATAHWYWIAASNLANLVVSDHGNVGGETLGAGTHTFYPSINVDQDGNVGLCFSASGPQIFPGAYYTARRTTTPQGVMFAPNPLAVGAAPYLRTFGGSRNRWGDYSAISLDPDNSSTFYIYSMFAGARGNGTPPEDGQWGTQWGFFNVRDHSFPDDFDNDGFSDLVLQYVNATSASHTKLELWSMLGNTRIRTSSFAPTKTSPDGTVATTGDFNGDLRADFVLKDGSNYRIWFMNGTSRVATVPVYAATTGTTLLSSNATPVGTGDFNADGVRDICAYNSTSRTVVVSYLSPASVSAGPRRLEQATYVLPTNTKLVGVADYSGDGVPDLVTQNTATTGTTKGNVTVYVLATGAIGTTTLAVTSARQMSPQITNGSEDVVSVVDLNGDNLADLVTKTGLNLAVRYRTIPLGQTVQTTTSLNFASPVSLQTNSSPPANLPLRNSYWSIRN